MILLLLIIVMKKIQLKFYLLVELIKVVLLKQLVKELLFYLMEKLNLKELNQLLKLNIKIGIKWILILERKEIKL
jgi:hypothetical protein